MPFANAARARGVGEATHRAHDTRCVTRLLPFATVVLLDASIMASGAVVTESVFAWPGIGSLFTRSAREARLYRAHGVPHVRARPPS